MPDEKSKTVRALAAHTQQTTCEHGSTIREGQQIERLAYAIHGVVAALNHAMPAGPAELDREMLSQLQGLADAALLLSSDLRDLVGEPGARS